MTLLPVSLPDGYEPKVSVGDKLTAGKIIAEKKSQGSDKIVHLYGEYGISPKNTLKSLQKNLGDRVDEGNIIAIKKAKFGLSSKKIISKFSGTIVKIDEQTGDVYLKGAVEETTENILSPVDGKVDFCNNEKIVIKTEKQAFLAEDALGKDSLGELLYLASSEQTDLTKKVDDKTVLTKKINKVSIFKALGLGAMGIIVEEFEDLDFLDLSDKIMQNPVMRVTDADFKKLEKETGKKVYMDAKNKSIIVL